MSESEQVLEDPDDWDEDEWEEDDDWDEDDEEDEDEVDEPEYATEDGAEGEASSENSEDFEERTPTEQEQFAMELQARLDPLDPMRRLEAVLFLAKEPLHSRKLSQLAGLEDGTQARSLVKRLNQLYDEQGRAFNVKQVAGGFQIRTRPMFSPWLRKVHGKPEKQKSPRLSAPALETLSVVAYRQPVLKAEVEAIRGVSCGELLRQLLDRGLVRITGRSPELGNPFMYGTTRRFLEVFGLSSIDSLPRAKRLRGKGLPDWNLSQDSSELSEETPDNMSSEYLGEPSIHETHSDSDEPKTDTSPPELKPENLTETTQNPLDES